MKFSVLGCGRWGSFISWYLCSKKGYDVCLYGRESSKAFQLLKNTQKNEYVSFLLVKHWGEKVKKQLILQILS